MHPEAMAPLDAFVKSGKDIASKVMANSRSTMAEDVRMSLANTLLNCVKRLSPVVNLERTRMARVTVEDCVDKVENRFDLVLIASHRARLIASGSALTIDRDNDKNPVVALREIAEMTQAPEDLKEDFIHSLQNQVEVDEPEAEVVPALSSAPAGVHSDSAPDVQFDRMTEEDLLRGLEGLVPPAATDDDVE